MMTDLALQIAGSKLAISVVLGAAVWLATRGNRRPRLCHALCLTLLAALLVPPLIGLPVLQPEPSAPAPADIASGDAAPPFAVAIGDARSGVPGGAGAGAWFAAYGGLGFVVLWLVGAVMILGWTVARMQGFRRSLRGASREAPVQLQRMAGEIARTLGLARPPTIHTTDALVSPMACWSGGAVRVLIPSTLVEGLSRSELRCILAHELAHVRRRDHVVRWIEWIACTAFWWNPVAWWARRRLRAAGEVCCDVLVVRALRCPPRDYARALVRAIDIVRKAGTRRPPILASAADSGRRTRSIELRLRMIVTNRPPSPLSRPLRLLLQGGLVASLALGLVYCSEGTAPTAVEVPGSASPPLNLTTADMEVVEPPPAEDMASPAEVGEPPEGIEMTGKTYAELVAALDGLQTLHYGQSEEPAARLGALSCFGCHADDRRVGQRTIPTSFRAKFGWTPQGGWSLGWELSRNPHDKTQSTNPGGIKRFSSWFPPRTIERVVVDRPPPPGW